MRLINIMGFCAGLVTSMAWAGGVPASDQAQARSAAPAEVASLSKVKRQQSRSEAEVQRLKGDVSRQQVDSEQADKRLQQQDEAIAELHKQLQELNARAPGDQR